MLSQFFDGLIVFSLISDEILPPENDVHADTGMVKVMVMELWMRNWIHFQNINSNKIRSFE